MIGLFEEGIKAVEEFSKLPPAEQDKILFPNGKITFYRGKPGDESQPLFSIGLETPLEDFVKRGSYDRVCTPFNMNRKEASMFDSFYKPYESELSIFGAHWCGPDKYKYGEKMLVAEYQKHEGGDGQNVKIFCEAMPARFYTIEVAAGVNSLNEPKKAYSLGTGSGQAELAAMIAKAIADGMLGINDQ